jgi:hypothetical protein
MLCLLKFKPDIYLNNVLNLSLCHSENIVWYRDIITVYAKIYTEHKTHYVAKMQSF